MRSAKKASASASAKAAGHCVTATIGEADLKFEPPAARTAVFLLAERSAEKRGGLGKRGWRIEDGGWKAGGVGNIQQRTANAQHPVRRLATGRAGRREVGRVTPCAPRAAPWRANHGNRPWRSPSPQTPCFWGQTSMVFEFRKTSGGAHGVTRPTSPFLSGDRLHRAVCSHFWQCQRGVPTPSIFYDGAAGAIGL